MRGHPRLTKAGTGPFSTTVLDSMIEGINLTKIYKTPASTVTVFENLNLSVEHGKLVSIIGASGAGKSTLLHLFGALDSPTHGQVLFKGEDIFQWGPQQ